MDSFYVVAASNASSDLHPDNSLTKFTNHLPQTLNIAEYKVALQSIFLDNNYGNMPNSFLGTNTHFVLFLSSASAPSAPSATYSVTDFTMHPKTFTTLANEALTKNGGMGRVKFDVLGLKIKIVLKNSLLIIHPEIQKSMKFQGGEKYSYNGQDYTMLKSSSGAKIFESENEFPRKTASPRVIKVQLSEMTQHLSDVNLPQDLAIIRVEPPHKFPFYNVCKRKEYFNLNSSRLSEISFCLVDENNFPLQLGHGQPTFIKLQFKRFPMKSHVLRLSSLESSAFFADNNSSSFRIILQQGLDCGKWDVSLSSVYLPSRTNIKSNLKSNNFYIELEDVEKKKVLLNDLEELTSEKFVELITSKLATTYPNGAPITITLENNILFLNFKQTIKAKISPLLAFLLGRTSTLTNNVWLLSGEAAKKTKLGKLNFNKLHPHALLIYCNFVTPLVIGNKYAQVLKIIPYSNGEEDENDDGVMKYEAPHLDFLPLSMNDRQILQFEMRNSAGELIKFQDPTEVLITLVFREKI